MVDSSIWINHLHRADARLNTLIDSRSVCMHSAVVGELMLGSLAKRRQSIADLLALPAIREADPAETRLMIEIHQLHGRGVGYIDAQLLASTLASGDRLWTADRRLAAVAEEVGVAYSL
ncbi:MAG TPA: PIN domain-containing protein [Jatrophihabitans sp.]|nr:PIN domain-containing protein [Jatrophihabitans sp.]